MTLLVRLETALAAIEARPSAGGASVAECQARLQRIEVAGAEAVRALDSLIEQE